MKHLKFTKTITALFLTMVILLSSSIGVVAEEFDVTKYVNPFTRDAYTENDFYGNGIIIIILSHKESITWREYTAEDFPELELELVDTKEPMSTDMDFIIRNSEYRNFVHITLKDKSNKAVVEAMELLYKRYEYIANGDIHMAIPVYKTYYNGSSGEELWDGGWTIGDVNGDSTANLTDASLILKYIAGWDDIKLDLMAADVNKDNAINLSDVSVLLKIIVY